MTSLGFGSGVMLGTMIPIVNFIIMPVAVCGATVYWVEQLSDRKTVRLLTQIKFLGLILIRGTAEYLYKRSAVIR
jgi:hypothetical protein